MPMMRRSATAHRRPCWRTSGPLLAFSSIREPASPWTYDTLTPTPLDSPSRFSLTRFSSKSKRRAGSSSSATEGSAFKEQNPCRSRVSASAAANQRSTIDEPLSRLASSSSCAMSVSTVHVGLVRSPFTAGSPSYNRQPTLRSHRS